jgi:hypothetical protein
MNHQQDRIDTAAEFGSCGDTIGDSSEDNLLLGPGKSGRHCRLLDQERFGDFGSAESTEHSQRERHLGVGRQARVATGEDQSKTVVFESVVRCYWTGVNIAGDEKTLRLNGDVATSSYVNGAASGHCRQPRTGVRWNALFTPRRQRLGESVLRALLRDVEVASDSNRGRQDERPLVTVGVRDGGRDRRTLTDVQLMSRIGRTSIPPKGAGMSLAMAVAASRSGASTT